MLDFLTLHGNDNDESEEDEDESDDDEDDDSEDDKEDDSSADDKEDDRSADDEVFADLLLLFFIESRIAFSMSFWLKPSSRLRLRAIRRGRRS